VDVVEPDYHEGAHLSADGDGKSQSRRDSRRVADAAKRGARSAVEMVRRKATTPWMQEFFDEGTLRSKTCARDCGWRCRSAVSIGAGDFGAAQYRQPILARFYRGYIPDPAARGKHEGWKEPGRNGETIERKIADSEPVSLFVF